MEPTDITTNISIDYVQLFTNNNSHYISNILSSISKPEKHRRNNNWESNQYQLIDYKQNPYKIIHSFNLENLQLNTIKICQPTLLQQFHLNNVLNNLKINHQLSKFELSFDMSPSTAATVTNGDIKEWIAMHLFQKYVPTKVNAFWIEDTFYTRPTRMKNGCGHRGVKLYEKLLNYKLVTRCELEMKRSYIKKRNIQFPITTIKDPLKNTLVFYEFDKDKFRDYLSENNKRFSNNQAKSMMELHRYVTKQTGNSKKYFKPLDIWNEYFQKALDEFNL
jgi:hypothetical protein